MRNPSWGCVVVVFAVGAALASFQRVDVHHWMDGESGKRLPMRAYRVGAPLLEKFSRLNPGNPEALCNLARARAGLGQIDQARAAVKKPPDVDPKHAGTQALLRKLQNPPRTEGARQ